MNINHEYESKNANGINYIREQLKNGGDMNIMLRGEELSGKSWIAQEIYNAVEGLKKKTTADELCSKFEHYKFSNYSDATEQLKRLRSLAYAPVLIVDDIGNEFSLGKTGIEFIRSFIETRLDFISRNKTLDIIYPEKIVTVFTSKLKGVEMAERYGNKVARGIPVKMQVIQIKGIPITYEVITPEGKSKKEV